MGWNTSFNIRFPRCLHLLVRINLRFMLDLQLCHDSAYLVFKMSDHSKYLLLNSVTSAVYPTVPMLLKCMKPTMPCFQILDLHLFEITNSRLRRSFFLLTKFMTNPVKFEKEEVQSRASCTNLCKKLTKNLNLGGELGGEICFSTARFVNSVKDQPLRQLII